MTSCVLYAQPKLLGITYLYTIDEYVHRWFFLGMARGRGDGVLLLRTHGADKRYG